MKISPFPFQTLDWSTVPKEEHSGETGKAFWQVKMVNDMRVRLVEYSVGYLADHWCNKGHVIYCIEGEMFTELQGGVSRKLSQGMCYFVGDDTQAHRSSTINGCLLLIVD
jgi:hypothetical protein